MCYTAMTATSSVHSLAVFNSSSQEIDGNLPALKFVWDCTAQLRNLMGESGPEKAIQASCLQMFDAHDCAPGGSETGGRGMVFCLNRPELPSSHKPAQRQGRTSCLSKIVQNRGPAPWDRGFA